MGVLPHLLAFLLLLPASCQRPDETQVNRKKPVVGKKAGSEAERRFSWAAVMLPPDRVSARRQVVASLRQAQRRGDHAQAAALNGMLSQEAFQRAYRTLKAWERRRNPATGLLPKNLSNPWWDGDNVGADCFPFMLLASHYLDPQTFPLWLETLAAERRFAGPLPKTIEVGSGLVKESPLPDVLFAGAEYAKDGLLSIAERLGRGPWFDRMEEVAGALIEQAPVKAAGGMIVGSDSEINGDVLQVLPRLYWATRKESYLAFAERTAEAYLFEIFPKFYGLIPLYWDFAAGAPQQHPRASQVKFRDHGNETILGLAELYVLEKRLGRPQAERYRQPLKAFFDRIVTLGRTPEGLWYDTVRVPTWEVKQRVSDNWGYVALALQAFDDAEGTSEYAEEIRRAMRGAAGKRSFEWEHRNPDGYCDSIEGMLYLLARHNLPECHEWTDDEIEVLFAKQDPSGFIEGTYLDGNFIRTALLYGMYKTQGVMPSPWSEGVQLGSSLDSATGTLTVSVNASAPWRGALLFDSPRHRTIWGMPVDYARLNSSPEWFAIDPDDVYRIRIGAGGRWKVVRGREMIDGLPVSLDGNRPLLVAVRRAS